MITYKDCPAEKRGQRRTQICHFIRLVDSTHSHAFMLRDHRMNKITNVYFYLYRREWINQFQLMFEMDPLLEEAMGDLWALVRVEGNDSHYQFFNTPYM